jgi:transposase
MKQTAATQNDPDCTPQPGLYLAIEQGERSWKLAFTTGWGQKPRHRGIPTGDVERLVEEIGRAKQRFGLRPTAPVFSCYEAGREGFWLARFLTDRGVDNVVVDSSSIEVNRRARRAKADGLDASKLVGQLVRYHAGERKVWSVVRVPSLEEEDNRQIHRELRTLKQSRTRVTNRIRGLLVSQGIRLRGLRDLARQLEQVRLWDGTPLPQGLRGRLERDWQEAQSYAARIEELETQCKRRLREEHSVALEQIRQLMQLRGLGRRSAWVFVMELFAWRKFRNRRQLGSLCGLTPTPYQSGNAGREQGIGKDGNRHVRAMAVEIAWIWLRYQPDSALSHWYERRFAGGGPRARRVGIVAVARKLLIELWRYLETGALPDGAVLKT